LYDKQLFLRNARSDELDSVALLVRDAYKQYESLLPPEAWKFYIEDMTNVRARLNESELIVAELDGQLVGTVTLYLDVSHSALKRWPKGWASIRLLAVHPAYRRRGIGSALMEECVRRCHNQGVDAIGLRTIEMMRAAHRIYEMMGFVRAPKYDLYPRPGVTVLAYWLNLKKQT
jgi:GNAT superfamily N-acetyltransferase